MDVCEVQSNATESPWIATVLADKKPVNFKLDSGADVTVVPYMLPYGISSGSEKFSKVHE